VSPLLLPDSKRHDSSTHTNYSNAESESSVQKCNNKSARSMMNNFFSMLGRPDGRREEKNDRERVTVAKDDSPTESSIIKETHLKPEKVGKTGISNFEKLASPVSVLCSDYFLENFSETVANLASGRWVNTFLAPSIKNESQVEYGRSILLCDSPIVDFAGVDIELHGCYGVMLVRLSQWLHNNQNDGVKAFAKRVLCLSATGRYAKIRIYVVCDTNFTQQLSLDFCTLQNTVVNQRDCGCPSEEISVHMTTIRALSTSIAQLILEVSESSTSDNNNNPEALLGILGVSREKIQDRAIFLISMAPKFTAIGALSCINAYLFDVDNTKKNTPSSNGIESAFLRLLRDAREMTADNEKAILRCRQKGISDVTQQPLLQLSISMKCDLRIAK